MRARGINGIAQLAVIAALVTLALIGVVASRAEAKSGAVVLDSGELNHPAGIAVSGSNTVIGATAEEPGGDGDFLIAAVDGRGQLQSSFRSGNLAGRRLDLGGDEEAEDVAVDASGRILQAGCSVVGNRARLAVVRYLPDGSPDSSWGQGGIVLIPTTYASCVSSIAVESDGQVVIAGRWQRPEEEGGGVAFITRLLSGGDIDPSFGWREIDFSGYDDSIEDLVLQPDGKIVAAGQTTRIGQTVLVGAVARVLSTGQPDPSFGQQGVLYLQDWTALNSVGLRGQAIIASGSSGRVGGSALVTTISPDGVVSQQFPLLSRLASTPAFNRLADKHNLDSRQRRQLTQLLRAGDKSVAASVQPDGDLVLGASRGYAISAVDSGGRIQSGFGDPLTPGLGFLFPQADSYLSLAEGLSDIAVDDHGGIVAVGEAAFGGLGVVRWNSSGRLDRSFGLASLRLRRADADLAVSGHQLRLRVGPEAVGGSARLTMATLKHSCRFVNFPPGASAPDGTYCQWRIVGERKQRTIRLRAHQLLDVGAVGADRRVIVGLRLPSFDRAYGRVLGTKLKAVVSDSGVKLCGRGDYGCGALG